MTKASSALKGIRVARLTFISSSESKCEKVSRLLIKKKKKRNKEEAVSVIMTNSWSLPLDPLHPLARHLPEPPAHQPSGDSNGKHHHPLHRLIPATFLFTKKKSDSIDYGGRLAAGKENMLANRV